ncbi:MAG: hypothetical protein R3Y26_05580 [Rikenellaceae bacterium]
MRFFIITFLIVVSWVTSFAQQRIDVVDGGFTDGESGYTTVEVNNQIKSSAFVVIQSTEKLSYTISGVVITDEEMKRSVDGDGIYVDTLCFYVNEVDSKRRLTLFAKGFPSEMIELNMLPKTTYTYMVIVPDSGTEIEEEEAESYEGIMAQGVVAFNSGKFDYAEKIFERACQIKESDEAFGYLSLSQYRQANILNKKYFYPKAIEASEKALKLNSENYLANVVLGAATYCKTSYKYKPSILYQGEERAERNRQWKLGHETAINHLQKALRLAEEYFIEDGFYGVDVNYEIAMAYYYLRDYSSARSYFAKVTRAYMLKAEKMLEIINK